MAAVRYYRLADRRALTPSTARFMNELRASHRKIPGGSRFTRDCQSKREWLRLEAVEADVLLNLEHLIGQRAEAEAADSQGGSEMPAPFERKLVTVHASYRI